MIVTGKQKLPIGTKLGQFKIKAEGEKIQIFGRKSYILGKKAIMAGITKPNTQEYEETGMFPSHDRWSLLLFAISVLVLFYSL